MPPKTTNAEPQTYDFDQTAINNANMIQVTNAIESGTTSTTANRQPNTALTQQNDSTDTQTPTAESMRTPQTVEISTTTNGNTSNDSLHQDVHVEQAEGTGNVGRDDNGDFVTMDHGSIQINDDEKKDRFLKLMNSSYGKALVKYSASEENAAEAAEQAPASFGAKAKKFFKESEAKTNKFVGKNAQRIGAFSNTSNAISNYETMRKFDKDGNPDVGSNAEGELNKALVILKSILGCVLMGKKVADSIKSKSYKVAAANITKIATTLGSLVGHIISLANGDVGRNIKRYTNFILPINSAIDAVTNIAMAIRSHKDAQKISNLKGNAGEENTIAKYSKLQSQARTNGALFITQAFLNISNFIPQIGYAIKYTQDPDAKQKSTKRWLMAMGGVGFATNVINAGINSADLTMAPADKKNAGLEAINTFHDLGDKNLTVNNAIPRNDNELDKFLDKGELNQTAFSVLGIKFPLVMGAKSKNEMDIMIQKTIGLA